jgi:serine/threonine protein phosphatase PrpC
MRAVGHGTSWIGKRPNNEDAFSVVDRFGLYVVADGMGGYEGGEIASRTAVDTVVRFFERMTPAGDLGLDDPTDGYALARSRMDLALRMAHRDIVRQKVGALHRMGSTIAALAIQNGRALIAHVGDSRVYRLRRRKLESMTRDHSLYAEMEAAGDSLPPRERCSFNHVITRALGAPGDSRADIRVEEAKPGDLFVLATDGLTDVVADRGIARALREEDLRDVPARLVADSMPRAQDNVTVIAVGIRA